MNSVEQRLNQLPQSLSPLRLACERHLAQQSELGDDGILNIGHRPWVAPLNYMIVLYPGVAQSAIQSYSETFAIQIPDFYEAFLQHVGGAFCFGISLFGIPSSMLAIPPFFNRSVLQCHDLGIAAKEWIGRYHVAEGWFHFGSRHFSRRENVGYFVDAGGSICVARTSGEVIGRWNDFTVFLFEELEASERLEIELHPASQL